MAGWAQTLFFFCTTVSAAAISHIGRSVTDEHAASDAGSSDIGHQYSVKYSVPCDHCSSGPQSQRVQIDLSVFPASHECGSENTLVLNGEPLPYTMWHHTIKQRINFTANPSDPTASAITVVADLQLGCLNADTSIMALNIVSLDHIKTPAQSGFTISFKQHDKVREINYTTVPLVDIDALDIDLEWGNPNSKAGFLREYQSLQIIEAAIDQLHERHRKQQQRIKELVIAEFKACDGLSCYLQRAKESAPYLSSLLKTLFCQKYKYKAGGASSGQIPLSSTEHVEQHIHQHDPSHSDGYLHADLNSDPNSDPSHEHYHANGNAFGITSQQTPHHRPSFVHQHRIPVILTLVGTVLVLSLAFVTVKAVKGKLGCCITPRLRREFAARREERRTRAAYRRAACRQKVRRWWSSFRKPTATSDYEEKRARILAQEGTLEHVMQDEITQLQRAHEIVTDMMRAEEGRQRMHHEVNFGTRNIPAYTYERGGGGGSNNVRNNGESSSLGSISTLPLYSSPPPSYDSDLGGDMTVVDGFNYTPSNSDNTSESSVVDCTSRLSFDTDSDGIQD